MPRIGDQEDLEHDAAALQRVLTESDSWFISSGIGTRFVATTFRRASAMDWSAWPTRVR